MKLHTDSSLTVATADSLAWRRLLDDVEHDIYHIPEYLICEAERAHSPCEVTIVRDGSAFFGAAYLVRQIDRSLGTDPDGCELRDAFQSWGYGGILVNKAGMESDGFAEYSIRKMQNSFRERDIVSAFFRMHPILNPGLCEKFVDDGMVRTGGTVSVDLTDSEVRIWAKTRKGHQSTINRCRRRGVTVVEESITEKHGTFLRIYNDTLSRVEAQDGYYIDDDYLHALGGIGEHFHLFVAYMNDVAVSACIVSECDGIVQAIVGGTLGEFISESPFSLLLHEIRIWARRRGNRFFHLGGGVGASTEDSLFRFKSGFSRTRHEYATLRMIANEEMYDMLCKQRAQFLDVSFSKIRDSHFFPAYRAGKFHAAGLRGTSAQAGSSDPPCEGRGTAAVASGSDGRRAGEGIA